MRIKSLTIPLFLSILTTPILCEIDIWGPSELKSLYKNKSFEYSIANFGIVPYGHSIIGTVKKSVPFDGCQDMSSIRNQNSEGALILLIMRGGCHFADKVINAQKIGANMVIIVDNLTENVHEIMPVERGKNLLNKVRWIHN
jgi:hypothetical protein